MQTQTELIDAVKASNEAEIKAIEEEIARQEEYIKQTQEWCAYTLERLHYRLSLLRPDPAPPVSEPGQPDEAHAAVIVGLEKKAA